MKRELKFRAWDKQYKMMANVTMLLLDAGELDHDQNTGEPKSIEHFELMQFTGLTDKNGKEIFEGDVIYSSDYFGCICGAGEFTDTIPERRIIIWDEKKCGFDFDFVDENMKGGRCSGYTLCKENAELKFEIIGNIYETPELLK